MYVEIVKQEIESRLNQLKRFFVPAMELTFIARKPGNDRADFVVTNDALAELAKVIERMQIQSGQKSEVAELRSEIARLRATLDGAQYDALEYGRDAYLQGLERAVEIVEKVGFNHCSCVDRERCASCGTVDEVLTDIRNETGGDQSEVARLRETNKYLANNNIALIEERNTFRDLERSYIQRLGEMARLADVVCGHILDPDLLCPSQEEITAAFALMEYVDEVRPPEGTPPTEWIVHVLGPDDIIPCASQFDALRRANEMNREWAKWCVENPSPNNPVMVAVVKQGGEVQG